MITNPAGTFHVHVKRMREDPSAALSTVYESVQSFAVCTHSPSVSVSTVKCGLYLRPSTTSSAVTVHVPVSIFVRVAYNAEHEIRLAAALPARRRGKQKTARQRRKAKRGKSVT